MLLPVEGAIVHNRYRRAILGKKDLSLSPVVQPGSIINIDTLQRGIVARSHWSHEFARPMYLLLTRPGYVCGWCDLDETGIWLTLVTTLFQGSQTNDGGTERKLKLSVGSLR